MVSQSFLWQEIDPILKQALEEDLGKGDITTDSLIPVEASLEAEWVAKEPCCLSGLVVVDRIFALLDSHIKCFWMFKEGEMIEPGKFGLIKGSAQNILKGERVALNFLQRLCGVSTLTYQFVEKVKKYGVEIYDTRKTTPGLRTLEKYAVKVGGGVNHRMRLDDMVLIKENHQYVLNDLSFEGFTNEKQSMNNHSLERTFVSHSTGLHKSIHTNEWPSKPLIQKIRKEHPQLQIGMEVEHVSQIKDVVAAGVNFVLLDNMTPEQVQEAVQLWKGKIVLEVSGGIRLDNIEAYAKAKPDRISIGALTHSVKAIDISLEVLSAQ